MSNKYWGWGLEDDEFFVRMRQANLVIERPKVIIRIIVIIIISIIDNITPGDPNREERNIPTRPHHQGTGLILCRKHGQSKIQISQLKWILKAIEPTLTNYRRRDTILYLDNRHQLPHFSISPQNYDKLFIATKDRPRDNTKCYNQRNLTRRRDKTTGLSNTLYRVASRRSLNIDGAPVNFLDIELGESWLTTFWQNE